MLLDVFPTGPLQANCTLVGDTLSGELVVIDPGAEPGLIARRIAAAGLHVTALLHTHGHIDHAGATAGLVQALDPGIPIGLNPGDLELYHSLPEQGRMFGISAEEPPEPTLWLEHGLRIPVGRFELEVRHTPGHSPGSVSFVVHGGTRPLVIAGDVLFAGSIGRTDLWGGSFEQLAESIRTQLYTLPDATRVITGHGPATTIGQERRTNPFVPGA
ncbi:MAG: MBL fold metallo-hydrolase [Acidobacteria bacterium]|nr:MBL fold metallo-hydrolase [Acidobacteriota bacterium]